MLFKYAEICGKSPILRRFSRLPLDKHDVQLCNFKSPTVTKDSGIGYRREESAANTPSQKNGGMQLPARIPGQTKALGMRWLWNCWW